ncbi:hypothetical protein OROGR_005906 [Orobanche gracilis]
MEQNEMAAGTVAPAAPVVRQLDFTVNIKATANANGVGSLILPEHPQAQLQSKLLALAQSRQVHAPARPQSPPGTASQTKLPPGKMVMPPKSPQRELSQKTRPAKSPVIAPRLIHSLNKASTSKPPLQPLLKMESPKSRERYNIEQNDGTPKKQKQCNSKYCECFASGIYCDGCNCINCHNNMEHEADRKVSIDAILERNPIAFRKIASSPDGATDGGVEHNKGCHCKKSGCLKRYCECFQANILCSDKCKCMDCKNFEGSEERKAHFHQYPMNSATFIQQATNAAINGAIGSPNKKSRNQQTVFGVAANKQLTSWPPQPHKENCSTSDTSNSSLSLYPSKPDAPISGLSKPSSYKSLLDGILQLQHVEDFCTLLVEVSVEAAQNLSKENDTSNGTEASEAERRPVSSSHKGGKDHQNQQGPVDSCGNQENIESNGFGIHNGRPLSPATLALMCDEQDTTFMAAEAPSPITESNPSTNVESVSASGVDQLYVEQERLVLIRFRNFLNRVITSASIEVNESGTRNRLGVVDRVISG